MLHYNIEKFNYNSYLHLKHSFISPWQFLVPVFQHFIHFYSQIIFITLFLLIWNLFMKLFFFMISFHLFGKNKDIPHLFLIVYQHNALLLRFHSTSLVRIKAFHIFLIVHLYDALELWKIVFFKNLFCKFLILLSSKFFSISCKFIFLKSLRAFYFYCYLL